MRNSLLNIHSHATTAPFDKLTGCHSSSRSHKGFTLVETLVAIAVLMIAIAGPLVIATKGLTSALYSKDQMIASFLAQESMEVVKNKHDNNIYAYPDEPALSTNWLAGFGTYCVGATNRCDSSGINSSGSIFQQCDDSSIPGCIVYYNDTTGYNTTGTGIQTQFYRHFYVVPVAGSNPPEVVVHVKVDWYEKSIPFEIHLTSSMVATSR